ncbi:MAG TPA: hypothetical protein VGL38_12965 [bacterium]|jgi:hypothetical protein
MKIAFHSVSVLTAILLLTAVVRGADLAVLNGDVELTVSSATAGQQPIAATSETCQLQWTTLVADATKKITAQSSLATPSFVLTVNAVSISAGDGTAAGPVTLSTSAGDLIVNIPAGVLVSDPGTCTLRYTASATAANGTGSDSHTITFTIVDQ